MKLKYLFVFISAFSLSIFVNADEVDPSSVTSFQDGSPALADEVNANFQVLIDAINGNAAIASENAQRLAALEESSQESNSIAGNTYQLDSIGIINRGDAVNYSGTSNLTSQYTVTFSSNGTFQLSGTENDAELNTDNNELTLIVQNDFVSVSGSYSQNGSNVTTSEEDISFTVSADGNVLIFSEFLYGPFEGVDESESSLVIGIRTN